MDAYTHIEADDQEVEVVSEARTCAQRDVATQMAQAELAFLHACRAAQQPHVARIEEGGSVELANDGESVLHVGLQLHVARLIYIRIAAVLGMMPPGADAAHAKGTHATGAAHGEES